MQISGMNFDLLELQNALCNAYQFLQSGPMYG